MRMLTNLTKAAIAAVATPVALVYDLVTAPASSIDTSRPIFGHTEKMASAAEKAFDAALQPEKDHG